MRVFKKKGRFIFLSRNKQNNAYPCKPRFYYIKVGIKGSKLYRHVFAMLCFRYTDEGIATEISPWKGQYENCWAGLKQSFTGAQALP